MECHNNESNDNKQLMCKLKTGFLARAHTHTHTHAPDNESTDQMYFYEATRMRQTTARIFLHSIVKSKYHKMRRHQTVKMEGEAKAVPCEHRRSNSIY